ncbi:hypothetical protein HETIRDRAFT_104332 [Heterobasidion irregulare TC 32-1]|uniref:Uncharacterized protein n=1 Tax=Heterobasidion irregulare (strain TC 32-1) TaxID=747525 RepID=W4K1P8_HETIT|nr:uncharacterized protein HETIRDRAFT_104332 [Heterobasidion irregulare TC 32-1]ETW79016.1 hypothetical protein HETIRDRAFT_104332 [Heterobasidion irregulare TC 32-1]
MSDSKVIDLDTTHSEALHNVHIHIPLEPPKILPDCHLLIADPLNVNLPTQSSALILLKPTSLHVLYVFDSDGQWLNKRFLAFLSIKTDLNYVIRTILRAYKARSG